MSKYERLTAIVQGYQCHICKDYESFLYCGSCDDSGFIVRNVDLCVRHLMNELISQGFIC